jgi:hypothetical protein
MTIRLKLHNTFSDMAEQTFSVGEDVHLYMPNHQGETTPGIVVAVLDLPGWATCNYVVEVEIGGPDSVLEVRSAFCLRRVPVLNEFSEPAGESISTDEWLRAKGLRHAI